MNHFDCSGWYDPELSTFGDRVAGAREQAGMTQLDLAERLGVKVETLIEWEDDFSEPRANKLSTMAGLLNVSLPWLLTGEGEGPGAPDLSGLSENMTEILSEMRTLRAQMQASVEQLNRLESRLRAALKEDIAG